MVKKIADAVIQYRTIILIIAIVITSIAGYFAITGVTQLAQSQ